MKKGILTICVCAGLAATASGQAVTGYSGGSSFDIYYGGSTGDVVGFRFEVSAPITVTHLGVWNADTTGGLSVDHQVGIWDDTFALLTDTTVTPASPTTLVNAPSPMIRAPPAAATRAARTSRR